MYKVVFGCCLFYSLHLWTFHWLFRTQRCTVLSDVNRPSGNLPKTVIVFLSPGLSFFNTSTVFVPVSRDRKAEVRFLVYNDNEIT